MENTQMVLRSGNAYSTTAAVSIKRKLASGSEHPPVSKKNKTSDGEKKGKSSKRDDIFHGGALKLKSSKPTKASITKADGTQLRVPIEILHELLRVLQEKEDTAALICLALTTKDLWRYAMRLFIRRTTTSNLAPSVKMELAPCLGQWMGQSYRQARTRMLSFGQNDACNVLFLPRSKYGSKSSDAERRLVRRYRDLDELNIPRRMKGGRVSYSKLPNPTGLGDQWYEDALTELIVHARQWEVEGNERWTTTMEEFWGVYERSELKKWVDGDDYDEENDEDGHYGDHYEVMANKSELRDIEGQFA